MKYSVDGFRPLYHNYCIFPINKTIKQFAGGFMTNQDDVFLYYNFLKFDMEYAAYGRYTCYKAPDGHFYKIDHFGSFYTIEHAENESDARHGLFEDTDLFEDKLSEPELIEQMRAWIEEYAL